jgi:flagellar biosynthesis protein FlhB
MSESQGGDKTEKPSAKRIKDAREKGQVSVSRDLSMAVGALAATGVLVTGGTFFMQRLAASVVNGLSRLGDAPLRDLQPGDIVPIVISGAALVAMTVGPVAIAAATASAFASAVQTGFNLSAQPLTPSFARLSPAAGLKKLAPSKAGIDTLKTLVTATVIGVIAWGIVKGVVADASRLTWTGPMVSADRGWSEGLRLFWQVSFALLAIGAADFGLQKWRHIQSLMMTKQEARDEAKTGETNPEVKARVRRIQRDMLRKRMFQAVPNATVVLVNPTHYAVALEYIREKSAAPIVVAKGADLIAARIREIARAHSVPIVENPTLARALFKECEIGDTIPGPLFGVVAEVLAYLIRIKQLVL